MINSQLNYLVAQQHADELRRTGERERLTASIRADRRAPRPTRWIARLRPAFIGRHSLVISDSM